jgi:hypothetical protein
LFRICPACRGLLHKPCMLPDYGREGDLHTLQTPSGTVSFETIDAGDAVISSNPKNPDSRKGGLTG